MVTILRIALSDEGTMVNSRRETRRSMSRVRAGSVMRYSTWLFLWLVTEMSFSTSPSWTMAPQKAESLLLDSVNEGIWSGSQVAISFTFATASQI